MPDTEHLAFLHQCEADAVERGHVATDPKEQDLHFDYAAVFAARIAALEKPDRAKPA